MSPADQDLDNEGRLDYELFQMDPCLCSLSVATQRGNVDFIILAFVKTIHHSFTSQMAS